jgi:hypothetical protein
VNLDVWPCAREGSRIAPLLLELGDVAFRQPQTSGKRRQVDHSRGLDPQTVPEHGIVLRGFLGRGCTVRVAPEDRQEFARHGRADQILPVRVESRRTSGRSELPGIPN